MHIFNLVAVIPSSIDRIIITIKALNMIKKDKEEYSYIIVSNFKLSPKNAYLDYKSTNKDLD